MVRVLAPWFENVSKRQVKAPKVFLRDSGLLHALLHVYAGSKAYALDDTIDVVPLTSIPRLADDLRRRV